MKTAAVIPVGGGREENVAAVLRSLKSQKRKHDLVVVVHDGSDLPRVKDGGLPLIQLWTPKHEPGDEQPRNIGVRAALNYDPEITHVHFVDSDVILHPFALDALAQTVRWWKPGIVIAPYDWLPPGVREPTWELRNDPRWEMFDLRHMEGPITNDLSVGLGCFSGNLLWDAEEFQRVGGFWAELYHGRCEDGELGLRAVAMDVSIAMCPGARGWHLDHPRSLEVIEARNARDVPMLNERHPWVQGGGLFVADRDGKSFDVHCKYCGADVPTGLWWSHCAQADHDMQIIPPRIEGVAAAIRGRGNATSDAADAVWTAAGGENTVWGGSDDE